MKNKLAEEKIEEPISLKLLFGGEKISIGKQFIIQKIIAQYLQETEKIDEL